MIKKYVLSVCVFTSAIFLYATEPDSSIAKYRAVLDFKPVGFWPADEGEGSILHDRSGQENHGRLVHAGWENGRPDFTSAYQWGEIPNSPRYQRKSFSFGGWVFLKDNVYGDRGAFSATSGRSGMVFFGNVYHSSGYCLQSLFDEPILTSQWKVTGGTENGVGLFIRRGEFLDVFSGGKADVTGTRSNKTAVGVGTWHHLLYTFDSAVPMEGGDLWKSMLEQTDCLGATGIGRLYLDGKLVGSETDVPFIRRNAFFMIGSDAGWWLQSNRSGSLDGSFCNLVFFDRALPDEEVQRLVDASRPETAPPVMDFAEGSLSPAKTVGELIRMITDETLVVGIRAAAVMELAAQKHHAQDVLPIWTAALEAVLRNEGTRMPRVEDLLRNALIRAISDTAPADPNVRELLARALPRGDGDNYFSQGDEFRDGRADTQTARAYTAAAIRDGVQYKIGKAVPFNSADPVSSSEFERIVSTLEADYPEVKNWEANQDHLYRVKIIKMSPNGQSEEAFLEGDRFVFDGSDAKLRGWSVALDQQGYIHLIGGMHNQPNPRDFIPGSWEQIGASREYRNDRYPSVLYWVSKNPGDITSFEFVGTRDNPRNIPVMHGMNYMNFVQDLQGVLYLYGRIYIQGVQSWGLYRYDPLMRQWTGLGGFPPDVKKEFPVWADEFIQRCADSSSLESLRWRHDHPQGRVLAWSRQAHFYNYCRSAWGIRFDQTNRMHVQLPLFGFDDRNCNVSSELYAWSDDGGRTFHRADGSAVGLPLKVNPSRGNNTETPEYSWQSSWTIWLSLLKDAGYADAQWVPSVKKRTNKNE
jgi:hypothetical protein